MGRRRDSENILKKKIYMSRSHKYRPDDLSKEVSSSMNQDMNSISSDYGTWVKNRFQNFSLFLKKHYISIVLLSFLLLSFSFSSSLFPLSFDMLISIISLVFREINDEVWQSLFFQNFQISYTSPIKTNYIVMDIINYNK